MSKLYNLFEDIREEKILPKTIIVGENTHESIYFDGNIEHDILNFIRTNFYISDKDEMFNELIKVINKASTLTGNIYKYFFKRLACDVKIKSCKYSVNEVLDNDELLQATYNFTTNNRKVFARGIVDNIETSFRVGSLFAAKPPNFPYKEMLNILERYLSDGGNYYDPSCGWGIRLLASAAKKDINYFGTDVNDKLVVKLNELINYINMIKPLFNAKIYLQGSEYFIEKLENNIDFIFTSPPYFDLEDYVHGDQSIKNKNYNAWLTEYAYPTMDNCIRYLKVDGIVAFNIKNINKKQPCYDDFYNYLQSKPNLVFLETIELKNIMRITPKKDVKHLNNNEDIMVFKKC